MMNEYKTSIKALEKLKQDELDEVPVVNKDGKKDKNLSQLVTQQALSISKHSLATITSPP